MRWGTILASVALTIDRYRTNDDVAVVLWCAGLLGYTAFRTFRPLRYMGTVRSLLSVLAEVALNAVAVVATGYWESPFIFSVMTAVVVAGFARGFGFAVRIAIVIALAVSLPFINTSNDAETIRLSAQWSLVLLLVALIAGYARRISGEADRQHSLALDRLGRLADANALLYSLHRVAQTLPASLDIDEVLDTTVGRLRGLFDFDFAAVLVLDETDGQWALLRREGARLPLRLATLDLPPPLTRALTEEREVRVADLSSEGGPGLALKSSSGIYAPLPARGSIIGLVAVEDQQREHFTERDGELLRGFVEPVGLAIDNARWFGRLRTVGADEERTRIARDLHDRIGQSLAYLAFELDRIVSTESRGEDIGESLERLRDDVRGVIREVRDTLYDLRTDVSDGDDLASVLDGFAFRIQERSGIEIKLICDRDHRLPILQEREMWRIAQEALTNIERHSGATKARIVWRCNGESAVLDITDNGAGFPIGRAGRLDSYGILGMRERASSIGATLDLTSREGEGTRVRCILLRQSEPEERPVAAASGA
ncbi:MAG: GAF domain-containing sensor histidine kinase [Acidimicrobiales bacterium]|nr:GAF domain-containing sensor histidine kinase [Acidimicrobiales bacterium]